MEQMETAQNMGEQTATFENRLEELVQYGNDHGGSIEAVYISELMGEYCKTVDQIEQVYVRKDRKGKQVVELVPRVGDQIVYLGPLDDYQKKLSKLKTFYEKAVGTVGWRKFAKVNLEYDNQIICTKRREGSILWFSVESFGLEFRN